MLLVLLFELFVLINLQVTCSTSGLCTSSKALALTVTSPPVITLRNSSYLSSLVKVKQGYSYKACAAGQQPTSGAFATHGF